MVAKDFTEVYCRGGWLIILTVWNVPKG